MQRRIAPLCALGLLLGCSARFSYDPIGPGPAPQADLAAAVDLALPEADGAADLSSGGEDGPPQADMAGPGPTVLSRGTFVGRAGHGGSGGVSVVRRDDGRVEVRMAEDFRVSGVVGPYVYLTSRSEMGNTVDASADLDLGVLTSTRGVQSYLVPEGGEAGRGYVFVWCRPFTVEIARAELRAP